MSRPKNGRGLFYTRDSGGKHEMTPGEYVEWARRQAGELELAFDGTAEEINRMMGSGQSVSGDLYLDFDVPGNEMSRPALNALIKRAAQDNEISHILIPRRDRLARPEDPIDGVKLENLIRKSGVAVVFKDLLLPALPRGGRQDTAELLLAVLDYDRSGKDRRDLAQKIIDAQIQLAKGGFSTGGRAPYGFRRWLVNGEGTPVRELEDGEYVKRQGHHVVWLPGPEEELATIRRILDMLMTMPASRVAATLTAEGIPSPDAGRCRTDNSIRHQVSGIWHQSTIVKTARNQLLVAVSSYGMRSMGDQLRFTPEGPRNLGESDFRPDEKPKVIRNPESKQITAPARFEPLVDPQEHQQLISVLDKRAGTQRGKPRSKDPKKNPLGSRVFDMNCNWPMYRQPYSGSFRYLCGFYQQSHGQECSHNHVDGLVATRFVLGSLRQRIVSSDLLPKLEKRLNQLAEQEAKASLPDRSLQDKRQGLAKVNEDLMIAKTNLARARSDEQFQAIATEFDALTLQQSILQAEIKKLEAAVPRENNPKAEVAAAMDLARRLTELAANSESLEASSEIIQLVNARLFLSFEPVKVKNRILNKPTGGILTFGSAPAPIKIYEGPTGRRKIKGSTVVVEPGGEGLPASPSLLVSDEEGKSLGNVSRGDRI